MKIRTARPGLFFSFLYFSVSDCSFGFTDSASFDDFSALQDPAG